MSQGNFTNHPHRRPAKFNTAGTFSDAPLRELARRFLKFAPFPDSDFDRGQEYIRGDGLLKKHVIRFPNMKVYGVRQFIAGKERFVAYAKGEQMDDALRFADAVTYRFWKYRKKSPGLIDPKQFNFSIPATEADLESWTDCAPEIIGLINDLEKHFLEEGFFTPPEERKENIHSKFARRTVAGELRSSFATLQDRADDRHQELIDQLAEVWTKLGELEKAIEVVRQRVTTSPIETEPAPLVTPWMPSAPFTGDPVYPITTCGNEVDKAIITNPNAHDSIFIPPLTGEVKITVNEPPKTT